MVILCCEFLHFPLSRYQISQPNFDCVVAWDPVVETWAEVGKLDLGRGGQAGPGPRWASWTWAQVGKLDLGPGGQA